MKMKAPISGTVLSVLVSEGDTVEEDKEIMVVEAMKMENIIYAEVGGNVSEIRVKAGDRVEEGDVLMLIGLIS